jgi:bilin biosynthesis protein
LVKTLQDPAEILRCEAAAALGQVNYAGAVEPLIRSMQDPDVDVRKAAVSSLGKVGNTATIPYLEAALQDPLPVISVLARIALQQLRNRLEEK